MKTTTDHSTPGDTSGAPRNLPAGGPVETDHRLTITAEELAAALGVSTWTIYEQQRKGELPVPAIKVGRRLVWSRARVASFLGADPLTGEQVIAVGQAQGA